MLLSSTSYCRYPINFFPITLTFALHFLTLLFSVRQNFLRKYFQGEACPNSHWNCSGFPAIIQILASKFFLLLATHEYE